jgi:hypothetical protein
VIGFSQQDAAIAKRFSARPSDRGVSVVFLGFWLTVFAVFGMQSAASAVSIPYTVTTFVGKSVAGGPGYYFSNLQYMRSDAAGNLIVADSGNGTIQQISPAAVALRIAGSQSTSCGTGASVDGPALTVCLDANSVAPVPDGSIYIADDTSIRRLASGNITTVAGISGPGSIGYADGTGSAVRFGGIRDIVVDPSGNLIIVDNAN